MWYARKRGEAAEEVTGSCRKKFSNIIPKGRPIRTAGRPNRPAVPRRVNAQGESMVREDYSSIADLTAASFGKLV